MNDWEAVWTAFAADTAGVQFIKDRRQQVFEFKPIVKLGGLVSSDLRLTYTRLYVLAPFLFHLSMPAASPASMALGIDGFGNIAAFVAFQCFCRRKC